MRGDRRTVTRAGCVVTIALKVPTAEKVDEPWIFRAACALKEPRVYLGRVDCGLILDLGFGIYKQIDATLEGVTVDKTIADLAVSFATNWAANGQPNPLAVTTLMPAGQRWYVHVERIELDLENLSAVSRSSLADALVEQGLAVRIADA